MIAFSFSPIKDVMHVKLRGLLFGLVAKCALMFVAALNQLANCGPALATVFGATALPMWRFVTSHAIGGIVLARSCFELGKGLWAKFAAWIKVRIFAPMFCIAGSITKNTLGMGRLALIEGTAIGTGNGDFVFSELGGNLGAVCNRAVLRTEMLCLWATIWKRGFVACSRRGLFSTTSCAGERDKTAIITPLGSERAIKFYAAVVADFVGHLTPPACLGPGYQVGRAARSVALVSG